MPSLNFKRQFAAAVLDGTKAQTIRATRKVPIKSGDTLHLFTGMRTKSCQKLGTKRCVRARPVTIWTSCCSGMVKVNGRELSPGEVAAMARADGFESVGAFLEFFATTHGPNFSGQLIEWGSTK